MKEKIEKKLEEHIEHLLKKEILDSSDYNILNRKLYEIELNEQPNSCCITMNNIICREEEE